MEEAVRVAVAGPADRVLVQGLAELEPVLERLGDSSLLVGGLMTKLWLHARPLDVPLRATADVDLGIDRRRLRLTGDRRLVGPLLRECGFDQRAGHAEFRFFKEIDGSTFVVDLLLSSGSSRAEPPLLEAGLPSVTIPGLAYAQTRPAVDFTADFSDGGGNHVLSLKLPTLDAAFVLKASLVQRGTRSRPDRQITDTADAIMLAAICADDDGAVGALKEHRRQSEVRDALRWIRRAFGSPRAAAAIRVQRHFESEAGLSTGAEWAVGVAGRLARAVG
jgi:hypothetical protein